MLYTYSSTVLWEAYGRLKGTIRNFMHDHTHITTSPSASSLLLCLTTQLAHMWLCDHHTEASDLPPKSPTHSHPHHYHSNTQSTYGRTFFCISLCILREPPYHLMHKSPITSLNKPTLWHLIFHSSLSPFQWLLQYSKTSYIPLSCFITIFLHSERIQGKGQLQYHI